MTLTREQVIEMAKQAGLTDMLRLDSEDSRELSVRRVQSFAALIESATEKRTYTAGRAAGLGEAAQKVRHILADCEEQDIDDPELESIAAAIEQLKEQSK